MVLELKQKSEATSIYVPEIATITKTCQMSPTEKLFDIKIDNPENQKAFNFCLLYTSPSPRDRQKSRMPSSA